MATSTEVWIWLLDTIELIKKAHEGDNEAREQVVVDNMALVWSIVRRFTGRGYDPDDLFQIGSIGLMKAIDRFDMTYDVKFSTYAVPMIIGEIKRFIRDDGIVKVSRNIKENGWKIHQASEMLMQLNNREPTVSEIAEYTGLSDDDVVMAATALQEVDSIYSTVYSGNGEDIYIVDRLSQEEQTNEQQRVINNIMISQLLDELSEGERNLIELRYYQDKTQTEVAKKMGISQVQVSRIEKRVLLKMRKKAACE